MKYLREAFLVSVSVGALFGATPASAQDQQAGAGAEQADDSGIDDIIVTAQRRSERLQDVPLAISALSSEHLAEAGVRNLEDVGGRVPGVYFKNLNVAQPQIYVRGIGTVQFDNSSEAPVGVFVDEVYVARFSAGLASLYDLDRLEVLRGPQGTLYGRNTIGGAINVNTRNPTRELEGEVGLSVGSYDAVRTNGAISGPLSESLSARVAFSTNNRRGWTKNNNTGVPANDESNAAARVKLLFEPSSTARFLLSGEYSRDRGAGFEQELKGTQNLGIAPAQVELTPNDPYLSQANVLGHQNRTTWRTSLRSEFDLSDRISLTSITAYQHNAFDGLRDLDAGPAPLIATKEDESGRQFSQELRLASTGSGPFKWLLGAYYFEESSRRTENWKLGGLFPVLPISLFAGDYFWTYDGRTTSYAAFGQVSYALNEQFEIVAGLRYTHDRKSGTYDVSSTAAFAVPTFVSPTVGFTSRVSDKWSSLDPSITLNFRPTNSLLLYAAYKEGFKSGGFQHRPSSALVASLPYDPEKLTSWEVGLKSEWFDRRLVANVSAFNYDYKDLQQLDLVPNTTVTFTSNVGSARVRGVEMELVAQPLKALELGVGYSFLDAKYRDFLDASGVQRRGNYLNRAPRNSLNLSGQYTAQVGDASRLAFRLEYMWRDQIFFNQDNAPVNRERPVGLLQARLAFTTANDRLSISVAGSNLTKEVYCANQIVSVPSSSAATCVVGAPRQFTLGLSYKF